MQASPVFSSLSPSFNSYSSGNLADIAARVVQEFREEQSDDLDSDMFNWDSTTAESKQEREDENEDEEFEFAVVCKKQDSPISADEIFFNGQIKPFYPLFDRNLLLDHDHGAYEDDDGNNNVRILSKTSRSPLGKLMSEERETDVVSMSCSSSEADDLDNLQPGTYCVWTPKGSKELMSPGTRSCKKSNSTGSSKRWNKFRDLLYRSNSDGKDTFVFLNTPNNDNKNKTAAAAAGKVKAVEEHYIRNRSIKEEDKKRSFLPYKQDLVGFFNNVNGFSRNLHPL